MKKLSERWDLRIVKAENGFRCNWLEELDEHGTLREFEAVFEEEGSEHGEIECFQRLLWFVTEHFGMVGSKHDARRISITIGGDDENVG